MMSDSSIKRILEKYEGQRIKADTDDRPEQYFVYKGKLHYLDISAARVCDEKGKEIQPLEAGEEEILSRKDLKGGSFDALKMQAILNDDPESQNMKKKVERVPDRIGCPDPGDLTMGQILKAMKPAHYISVGAIIITVAVAAFTFRGYIDKAEIDRHKLEAAQVRAEKLSSSELPLMKYLGLSEEGKKLIQAVNTGNPVNIKMLSGEKKIEEREMAAQAKILSDELGWIELDGDVARITEKGKRDFSTFKDLVYSIAVWGE